MNRRSAEKERDGIEPRELVRGKMGGPDPGRCVEDGGWKCERHSGEQSGV